ncbi:molybdopterin molybdotransferase MoeA [Microbulbifer sp. OS29]|uniref:Molybdopterin molybdenumtransferase n=1 Tax=Microbulbifer okhotskensis TaxID=2926617 RepID=A0A9X2EMP2_9GAMM|nr:gephyrin-like molybdotransferase Glp [Microbulbifer okhotskensis]MCO1334556.1 molybdopterin molybdotransferase MoeA [Microbulbifer okhotskensis]
MPAIDCCSQPGLMPIESARETLLQALKPVSGTEVISLAQATGRVLAENVVSTVNLPPCDNSAMDGYALRFEDLASGLPLELIGKSFAGAPFDGVVNPGTCVRIMTGAALPAGADTVVMQENVDAQGESIRITCDVRPGDHIRRCGEDVAEGSSLLQAGERISVPHIALIAAVGVGNVTVVRKPVVALFSTGDELRQPGDALSKGDIYDSNRIALLAALAQMDLDVLDLGILPDNKQTISDALERAAKEADAIITSGGVSVGEADYTREVLEELGEIGFWKVAMKPGKPFAFGFLQGTPFFGLPGNPVSALVTFYQLTVPALGVMKGIKWSGPQTLQAKLLKPLKKKPGRTDFQRGVYRSDENGELVVEPVGAQGSHILTGLAAANCFIVLARESGSVEAGDRVAIEPLGVPLG